VTELLLLVLAAVLVAVCGVFVAAEFALLAVDRPTVSRAAEAGDRRAAGVQRAFSTLSTQLSGVQLGITITNLAIGYLAEPSIASLIAPPLEAAGLGTGAAEGVAVAIALVLATGATVLFGELVPKNLAIARPLETALAVQGAIRGFTRVMAWPIRLLNGTADLVLHRFGLEAQEELASARSVDELLSLVQRSATMGTLESDTAALLQRSLVFGDKRATDVLVPRVRMRTLPSTATAADVLAAVRRTGHSRFPVVGEDLDDVVGIVHVKAAVAVPEPSRATTPVTQVMAEPVIVPGTVDLDSLMDTLQAGGLQMAVVIDEFGGTDGLVTIEDLIEELVGEVVDEHDRTAAPARRRRGGWSVSGLLRPDEVTAATGVPVPEGPDYETVAGLLVQRLGRIPSVGDAAEVGGVRLVVERMDRMRVDRVLLLPAPEVEAEADARTERVERGQRA
jgi:CBS domain containing-hemolysin-like protein